VASFPYFDGTGSVSTLKTRHKISVDIRIFFTVYMLSCSPPYGRGHYAVLQSVRLSVCMSLTLSCMALAQQQFILGLRLLNRTPIGSPMLGVESTGQLLLPEMTETAMKWSLAPLQKNSLGGSTIDRAASICCRRGHTVSEWFVLP